MMTMNKRGRGFDCERQNNKSLMQSCLDILYVFYSIFFLQKYNFLFSGRRITNLFRNMPAGRKYDPVCEARESAAQSEEHSQRQ